jgi:hypothetical protein
MLEKVPANVASRCWPYLDVKPSHVGVDVDGLPPTLSYSLQPSYEGTRLPARRHLVPSCNSGRWRFTGGCKGPGLGYLWRC